MEARSEEHGRNTEGRGVATNPVEALLAGYVGGDEIENILRSSSMPGHFASMALQEVNIRKEGDRKRNQLLEEIDRSRAHDDKVSGDGFVPGMDLTDGVPEFRRVLQDYGEADVFLPLEIFEKRPLSTACLARDLFGREAHNAFRLDNALGGIENLFACVPSFCHWQEVRSRNYGSERRPVI